MLSKTIYTLFFGANPPVKLCSLHIRTLAIIHASRTESDSDTLVVWKTEPGSVLNAVFAMRTRGMRLSLTVYVAGRTAFNPRNPRRMRLLLQMTHTLA